MQMKKLLIKITDNCALVYEDIVAVTKHYKVYQNEYMSTREYIVQIILDKQPIPINISCDTEEEMNELYEKIIKERNR